MALLEMIRGVFEGVRRYFLRHHSVYEELTDLGPLTPFIQHQLMKVYLATFAVMASLSLGCGLDLHWKIGGLGTVVGFLGMFAWFCLALRWREGKRICLLIVAAFFLGASMYRTIAYGLFKIQHMINDQDGAIIVHQSDFFFTIDESHLLNTLIGIATVFGCYAIASMPDYEGEGRWIIYIVGLLLSDALLLVWALISTETSDNIKPYVYVGFFLFIVYVSAYSQEMVVRIRHRNTYYTELAIALFTQMPAFIHHFTYSFITRQRRADLPNGEVQDWHENRIRHNL